MVIDNLLKVSYNVAMTHTKNTLSFIGSDLSSCVVLCLAMIGRDILMGGGSVFSIQLKSNYD